MLKQLEIVSNNLRDILLEKANNNEIETMYIDYYKPFVSRIWFKYEDIRVFLHKIEQCESSKDVLYHPHKWDSAMEIIQGSYEMGIGHSENNEIPKTDCKIILNKGSKYEMTEKDGWHYVFPLNDDCYTLMISGRLNGREMPIEPMKKFRKLNEKEIYDILKAFNLFGHYDNTLKEISLKISKK